VTREVLRLEGLYKRFGGIVVADNISLSIEAGQILGLIGPNGAGKTSLFNLVSGIVQPDAGQIFLDGSRIDAAPVHHRARAGIARTWQHMRLFHSMTVLENLMIAPRSYPGESLVGALFGTAAVRRAEVENRRRAMSILERMGLTGAAGSIVVDLPFGQQKLIGLARALMNDGSCLLLDEPMAGVEGANYLTMQRVVRDEAASGRAVCVVEHNVSFIKDLCNTAVFMAQGRILQRGSVHELTRSRELTELYFGVVEEKDGVDAGV
jgi:branched-chain amino acid transport system ATP-binding protein